MNLAKDVPASGVRDTRSLHEHNNAIKLRRNTSRWWPHPRVRTSPEVGPGATVGTPGLGYPLLLCLGKGFVIILGYDQIAGPLWSGVLILLTTAPDLSHDWERSGNAACPGRGGRSAQTAGAPDLPWSPDPRGSPGPLMGSRTTCIVTGPLAKGRSRRPASGWSGADTCLQARTRIQGRLVSIQGLTHHCIHCGRWTSALM
jgi:hypothetical protein